MKKLILLTTGLFLVTATYVNAQSSTTTTHRGAEYWSLGPIGGFGHSWMMGMDNQKFMPSGELGIGVIYSEVEHWGVGADLTGSLEGYATEYSQYAYDYNTKVMPLYLRLTPKVYYFFGDYGDNIRPKIYLGPSVGYKLSETQRVTYSGYHNGDMPPVTVDPNGEVFKDWDLGVKAGVGANVRLAKSTWFNFDGGYYQGLVDVTGMDHMNSNVRLNVGVMFGL